MEEIMGLIESAVEREAGDSIEAHVGPDGQVEETGAFAHIMNALSKSPDTLFPMCSPVGIAARLHLLCAITVISARIIIRGPPDFEKLANEHHCPNPGHHLPEPLEELSEKEDGTLTPVPFLIDQDIIARERPTYAWYARHVFNMYGAFGRINSDRDLCLKCLSWRSLDAAAPCLLPDHPIQSIARTKLI